MIKQKKPGLLITVLALTVWLIGCTTTSDGSYPAPSLGVVLDVHFTVIDIQKRSAAEKAGVQVGDVLLTLDGNSYATPDEWIDPLGAMEVGQKYQITVQRGSDTLALEVTAARQAPDIYSPGVTPTPIPSGLYAP